MSKKYWNNHKKKLLRKCTALLTAAALAAVLGGCGAAGTAGSADSQDSAKGQGGEDAPLSAVNVLFDWDYTDSYDQGEANTYLYSTFVSDAAVVEEGYEALEKSLKALCEENVRLQKQTFDRVLPDVKDLELGEYESCQLTSSFQLMRSDSRMVSICGEFCEDLGGVHPFYYRKGYNFDSADGKRLVTSDMITDKDAFYEAALAGLDKLNAEREECFDKDTCTEILKEQFDEHYDELDLYTDPQNLYLYFPVYMFGPYVAGDTEIAIPLKDCKGFLREQYIYPEGPVIYRLPEPQEDWSGSSEYTTTSVCYLEEGLALNILSEFDYEDWSGSLTINCNDIEGYFSAEFPLKRAYLVKPENGKTYLYAEMMGIDDYLGMMIFDLDGTPEQVGKFDGYFGDHLSTIPSEMTLYQTLGMLGTYQGFKRYHVSEGGMPVSDSDEFTYINSYLPQYYGGSITSTMELPLEIDGELVYLPEGTVFTPVGACPQDYALLRLADGRTGKLFTEMHDEGLMVRWGNGALSNQFDCFEELYFAG